VRDKLHVFVALVVIVAIVALGALFVELSGLRLKWQAQAETARMQRLQAQEELLEQRQQGWLLLPGVVAVLTDTAIATAATVVGWVLAAAMIVIQVTERVRR